MLEKILNYSKNVPIFDLVKSFKEAIKDNTPFINTFLSLGEKLLGKEINDKDTSFLKIDFPGNERI